MNQGPTATVIFGKVGKISKKKVEEFSEIENVSGKKILDFFAGMVHNEGCPIRRNKQMCCKTHLTAGKTGGKTANTANLCRKPAWCHETAGLRICWKAVFIKHRKRAAGVTARALAMPGQSRRFPALFFFKKGDGVSASPPGAITIGGWMTWVPCQAIPF